MIPTCNHGQGELDKWKVNDQTDVMLMPSGGGFTKLGFGWMASIISTYLLSMFYYFGHNIRSLFPTKALYAKKFLRLLNFYDKDVRS